MSGCDSPRHDPWSFDTDNRWRVHYAGYYKVQLLHSAFVAHWRWLILSLTPAFRRRVSLIKYLFLNQEFIDVFVKNKTRDAFKNKNVIQTRALERIINMTS